MPAETDTRACFFCQRDYPETGLLVEPAFDVYICQDCSAHCQAKLDRGEGLRTKDAVCTFCRQPPTFERPLIEASNHLAFICLECAKICQDVFKHELRRRADQIPFASQAWKRSEPNERGRMIDDLFRRYDFNDWTRADVEELLGPPDHDPSRLAADWHTAYNLGQGRDGPSSHFLVFRFDDQEQVSAYQTTVTDRV
jgi:ClpX C4-type zinc finger